MLGAAQVPATVGMDRLPGQVRVGAWPSTTVIVTEQVVVLAELVAWNTTTWTPTGKVEPLAKGPEVCVTGNVPQLSEAVALG